MKVEQQVCSLELAKNLKALNLKQESYFCWAQPSSGDKIKEWIGEGDEFRLFATDGFLINKNAFSAFTVAELVCMLQEIKKEDIIIAGENNKVADSLATELIELYEKDSKV